MTPTKWPLTLAALDNQLRGLQRGARLTIGGPSVRQLFGEEAAASSQLVNFAKGHDCTAQRFDDAVTFHKAG